MVSFRFHLVSLIAVFLALALGIGMGVTVIDKATVDLLQAQLNNVRDDVNAANQRSSQLQTQLNQNDDFAEQANRYLIQNRLDDVAVVLIRAQGVDSASIDQLQRTVQEAGGTIRGSLTVNDRMNLVDEDDRNDLASALGAGATDAPALRAAFINRISSVMSGGAGGSSLASLVEAGFVSWAPAEGGSPLESTQFAGSRLVVNSGAAPAVSNEDLLVPLTKQLAVATPSRVLAVEAGVPASGDAPEARAIFVTPLRDDRSIRDALSTVDNLERSAGQTAAVLALAQLGSGRVGHYGVAGSASAVLPPLPS